MSNRLVNSLLILLEAIAGPSPSLGMQANPLLIPPHQPQTDPMFAASPQRELRRAWDDCVWSVEYPLVSQGRNAEDAAASAFSLCEDLESRLTGAMVREFGFERGNAAIQRARNAHLTEIRRQVAERDNPQRPPGFVGEIAGWQIFRTRPHTCIVESAISASTSNYVTQVITSSTGSVLAFLTFPPDLMRRTLDQVSGRTLHLPSLYFYNDRYGTQQYRSLGNLDVYINHSSTPNGSEFLLFSIESSEEFMNSIRDANRIQISLQQFGYGVYIFNATQIYQAWQASRQCAQE